MITYEGRFHADSSGPTPVGWHRFALSVGAQREHWSAVYEWCEENFGGYGEQDWPLDRWSASIKCFWVRREADAFAFRMRWC